jgi:hypothetical protein
LRGRTFTGAAFLVVFLICPVIASPAQPDVTIQHRGGGGVQLDCFVALLASRAPRNDKLGHGGFFCFISLPLREAVGRQPPAIFPVHTLASSPQSVLDQIQFPVSQ